MYPYIVNYQQLVNDIHNAQVMYHVFKEPLINDMRYDAMVREQSRLLKEYPELAEKKAACRSIQEQLLHNGDTARHDYPMLRLNRKDDIGGVISWLKTLPQGSHIDIEVKVTGVDIDLIYVDGKLNRAITFGDGLLGRDITLNAYCIQGVPSTINIKERLSIRGTVTSKTLLVNSEGLVSSLTGEELKAHISKLLHRPNPDRSFKDALFVAHTVSYPGAVLVDSKECDIKLRMNGFTSPKCYGVKLKADIYERGHWEEIFDSIKTRILNSNYLPPFNGLVLKVCEMEHRYELGYTSRFPEWALAFTPKEGFTNGPDQTA